MFGSCLGMMEEFNQGGQHQVMVGAFNGMMGLSVPSSGPDRGYEVVVSVGDCFRSWWVVEGCLAHLFSQGRGHGLWPSGMVDGVVQPLAHSFGKNRGQKHGSCTMRLRW